MPEMTSIPRGELVKGFNRRIARVVAGIEESAVRDILGEPSETNSQHEIETPGNVFRSLGSTFNLDQGEIDTVWDYRDSQRPRITHRIGFSGGRVVTRWKENERASPG
jgi:hypothetical protein